jgi:hypothetical protein
MCLIYWRPISVHFVPISRGKPMKWLTYKHKWQETIFGFKGQLNSEWIYEVIVSPKIQTKNYKDFCHTKQTRIVAKKKLPTLTKKSPKKVLPSFLFGRAEILVISGLHFGPSIKSKAVCSKRSVCYGTLRITRRAPRGARRTAHHSPGVHRAAPSNVPKGRGQ